jgi:hypothetical protein
MDKNWVWSCRIQIDVWGTAGMQKICEEERRKKLGRREEAGFLFFGLETTHDRTQMVKMGART